MKYLLLGLTLIIPFISALAESESYHFDAYTFDTEALSIPAGSGDGNSEVCKYLFTGPGMYDGPWIMIGTNSTVFGVVCVTDGESTKTIPLFEFVHEKNGKIYYGCNGPTPIYAHQSESKKELIESIIKTLRK